MCAAGERTSATVTVRFGARGEPNRHGAGWIALQEISRGDGRGSGVSDGPQALNRKDLALLDQRAVRVTAAHAIEHLERVTRGVVSQERTSLREAIALVEHGAQLRALSWNGAR